jgi:hypothetical protein
MTDRLTEGQSGYVIDGGRKKRGSVAEVQPKGYRFHVEGEAEPRHFSEKKVKPERPKKAGSIKRRPSSAAKIGRACAEEEGPLAEEQAEQEDDEEEPREIMHVSTTARLKSVFRQPLPDICDEYRQWVKTLPCANRRCPSPGEHIDPHHEGKKGVSMKRPDWDCVPLCWLCHKKITDDYEIPGYSREETTAWLADVKNELKNRLLSAIARTAVVAALRVMTRSAA